LSRSLQEAVPKKEKMIKVLTEQVAGTDQQNLTAQYSIYNLLYPSRMFQGLPFDKARMVISNSAIEDTNLQMKKIGLIVPSSQATLVVSFSFQTKDPEHFQPLQKLES